MRKDAQANRDRLILAGKRLMQDEGGDVPVERFCELAEVTRGTFYRNFTDRASLYEAVLEQELSAMALALQASHDDPLAFLRLYIEMMMVYDRFLAALPGMDDYRADGESEGKIVAAIAPSLERAKAAGAIATRVTGDDVMLACRMAASDWRLDRQPSREAAMERRLALLMVGLAS